MQIMGRVDFLQIAYSLLYLLFSQPLAHHCQSDDGHCEFGYCDTSAQMIVSLGSGPWDQHFGSGNSPAFAVGAISAFIGGLIAIIALPRSQVARRRVSHRGAVFF